MAAVRLGAAGCFSGTARFLFADGLAAVGRVAFFPPAEADLAFPVALLVFAVEEVRLGREGVVFRDMVVPPVNRNGR